MAYSDYWDMAFAMHINGEPIRVAQPTLTFNGSYTVKPDNFDGERMYVHTGKQVLKIIDLLDSGNCSVKVTFYLNGQKKSRVFRYKAPRNACGKAVRSIRYQF